MSIMGGELSAPSLEFVFELRVTIAATVEIGSTASGVRRTVPITGGTFHGPRISGRVMPGGADWQLVQSDGLTHVDAHYILETDDGVRIEVRNEGIRHGASSVLARIVAGERVDPSEYYFRTTPRFRPSGGSYGWLERSVFLGLAERYSDLVIIKVWMVL